MVWVYTLIILIIINEALTELVSKSVFFGPLRDFLSNHKNPILLFFGRAFQCPYCTSVWVSIFTTSLTFISIIPFVTGIIYIDAFVYFILGHRGSNLFHDSCDRYINKSYK
jgi:hypothetical protein